MKNVLFCIAYLSLHDGELIQKTVTAANKLEAYQRFLATMDAHEGNDSLLCGTAEEVEERCFTWDVYISAIEL